MRFEYNPKKKKKKKSSLIGVNFPMNSVGVLPTNFLSASQEFVTKSLFANSKEILSQFLRKSGS